ncbi:methyltransferase domain-containing protein [Nocardioides sp.]|uniref:methyltransferase domain-containing protein n=1 Tax=Nocardioides sp. TaxID=35761 RepID=UPI002B26C128|nr:methyltransferase domain-containing protein [Nocardioides sp.]
MFFDEYPRFLDTSVTAAGQRRLDIRQEAMIAQHAHLLRGKRVLDIASHDGRWSFAALKTAGASHVTGVEANSALVSNAEETFQHYGVSKDQYRFIDADVFEVLADPARHGIEVDVVMCLGFNTTRCATPSSSTGSAPSSRSAC